VDAQLPRHLGARAPAAEGEQVEDGDGSID